MIFNRTKFITMVRNEIVKFSKFPDCIREYDTRVECVYRTSNISIVFYEKYIHVVRNGDIDEELSYDNINYLDSMIISSMAN